MSKQVEKQAINAVEKNHKINKYIPAVKPKDTTSKSNYNSKKGSNMRCPPKKITKISLVGDDKSKEDTENKNCVENTVDLSTPNLFSTLQLASEIQAASIESRPTQTLSQLKELHGLNKIKISKKTNIPFSKQIFQNLVDLQISDNEFSSVKKLSKPTNFSQKKDVVFNLCSFYKPDFSTECCVKPKEVPQEMEYVQHYNGCEIYDRIKSLTSS